MNTPNVPVAFRSRALAVVGCALVLALAAAPSVATAAEPHPVAAEKAMPLKASFEKDTSGKNEAPMILRLKNDSAQAITVSGQIALSVVVHNRPKSRAVPEQKIEAGAVLTLDNLAPEDKVTLRAEGYAPFEVTVPYNP